MINRLIFALALFFCCVGCISINCRDDNGRRLVVEQRKMEEEDLSEIMGQFAMQIRKDVVKILLTGNDTQCFTTEQYLDKYISVVHKGQKLGMDLHLARRHLKSTKMVREIKSDLWAPKMDNTGPLRKMEAESLKKLADIKGE